MFLLDVAQKVFYLPDGKSTFSGSYGNFWPDVTSNQGSLNWRLETTPGAEQKSLVSGKFRLKAAENQGLGPIFSPEKMERHGGLPEIGVPKIVGL